ncbi:hypothetical protein IAQ61_010118 [Plenodomus lingam]|uniref:uncharacterized protein n=1 Tax=Leptosphaeria maculans TaxID=5022 RepID=UPI00331DA057|nr:hypothetical protein IAQ61_010118 [Plenodomus lingam]
MSTSLDPTYIGDMNKLPPPLLQPTSPVANDPHLPADSATRSHTHAPASWHPRARPASLLLVVFCSTVPYLYLEREKISRRQSIHDDGVLARWCRVHCGVW